jgi:WhiB family redox-sensing transcriptional regulator
MNHDWQKAAACAPYPALFRTDSTVGPIVAQAKAICTQCPSRTECLEWAMDKEAGATPSGRYGIYGGLTSDERWRLHKQRRAGVGA